MSSATPPSVPGPIQPESPDDQHLKLLSIFYYVMAGLALIGVCLGLVYTGFGIAILFAPIEPTNGSDPPVGVLGGGIMGVGAFVLLLSIVSGVLQFLTARYLAARRRRIFCLVIAAINCLSVPLGTILGVFTIIVLVRPSVIAQFEATPATLP